MKNFPGEQQGHEEVARIIFNIVDLLTLPVAGWLSGHELDPSILLAANQFACALEGTAIGLDAVAAEMLGEEAFKHGKQALVLQTLVFPKEKFPTAEDALKWARDHGMKVSKVDETDDSWRVRQRDPADFKPDSFRTIKIKGGIAAVMGRLKKLQPPESTPVAADEAPVSSPAGVLAEQVKMLSATVKALRFEMQFGVKPLPQPEMVFDCSEMDGLLLEAGEDDGQHEGYKFGMTNGVPWLEVTARVFKTGTWKESKFEDQHLELMEQQFRAPKDDRHFTVPMQLDHEHGARATIGQVRKVYKRGHRLYQRQRYIGRQGIENVLGGLWVRQSVCVRDDYSLKETSVVAHPAVPDAASFSEQPDGMLAVERLFHRPPPRASLHDTLDRMCAGTITPDEATALFFAADDTDFAKDGWQVTGARSLPMAPEDHKWDAAAAQKRMQQHASDADGKMDMAKFGKGHVMAESVKMRMMGGFHLPFADMIDGKMTAVPAALRAASAALSGARGGFNAPESAKKRAAAFIKSYQKSSAESGGKSHQHNEEETPMSATPETPDGQQVTSAAQTEAAATAPASTQQAMPAVMLHLSLPPLPPPPGVEPVQQQTEGAALSQHQVKEIVETALVAERERAEQQRQTDAQSWQEKFAVLDAAEKARAQADQQREAANAVNQILFDLQVKGKITAAERDAQRTLLLSLSDDQRKIYLETFAVRPTVAHFGAVSEATTSATPRHDGTNAVLSEDEIQSQADRLAKQAGFAKNDRGKYAKPNGGAVKMA